MKIAVFGETGQVATELIRRAPDDVALTVLGRDKAEFMMPELVHDVARTIEADPRCVTDPILELNLEEAGITSILWATGYSVDYSWLKVDAFDEAGKPKHQRGVSTEPGVYFLGLPWQSRRGSSFIWGAAPADSRWMSVWRIAS